MKTMLLFGLTSVLTISLAAPPVAWAQRGNRKSEARKSEADFVTAKPAVGEPIPDVVVYDAKGHKVSTADLRGHYTVLTFGCLT